MPERTVNTKFYTFHQNNSGGYYIRDKEQGIGETVIIEAQNKDEAWEILQRKGETVDSFNDYCPCCGERWSSIWDEDDADEVPSIWGRPIEENPDRNCYIHYYNGTITYLEAEN